ncbi:MAG: hypothetical protein HYS12_16560 [Planctomycetes bacterium]|nr:hypothetical protein [Planctomycetota bacterium]
MKVPSVRLMRNLGLEPDPWQIEVLESTRQRLLLNCCRQAGKSTVVALLALAEAMWTSGAKVLLVSRSFRQSKELFRIVTGFYEQLEKPICKRITAEELTLANGSRIVSLPCKEQTIRGFSNISLLIIDEASIVPDDIYRACRPMLAVSNGRMICLSTPRGKRGYFYDAWSRGGDDWHKIEVPASMISRIKPEFLEGERRDHGDTSFRQEYCCSFEVLEGLVYPELARCVVPGPAPDLKRRVGGIDFGFRNPFAAVWGGVDRDDVLWLTGQHYCRQRPLSHHAVQLPRKVEWFADPSGAGDIAELRRAGFTVNKGKNAIASGIAAVQARIQHGTLRILQNACPDLIAEAGLYCYASGPGQGSEEPIPEYNHALDALRYLISRLDHGRQVPPGTGDPPSDPPKPKKPSFWERVRDDRWWTPVRW